MWKYSAQTKEPGEKEQDTIAALDANLLKKGEDFGNQPETWVIFITEDDVMGKGLSLYPVERCFLGIGKKFEDGSHILYVSG